MLTAHADHARGRASGSPTGRRSQAPGSIARRRTPRSRASGSGSTCVGCPDARLRAGTRGIAAWPAMAVVNALARTAVIAQLARQPRIASTDHGATRTTGDYACALTSRSSRGSRRAVRRRRGRADAPRPPSTRAVMPHTVEPVDRVGGVAHAPAADLALDHARSSPRRAGTRRAAARGSSATSVGWARERGPALRDGDDRRHREVADRDPQRRPACPRTRTPACVGVQPHLLGRLAQRGRDEVGVLGLGAAARERHLARVVAAAVDALGEQRRRASPASSG